MNHILIKISIDDHEKSQIFNTNYSSVWIDDSGIFPDFSHRVSVDTNIADIQNDIVLNFLRLLMC